MDSASLGGGGAAGHTTQCVGLPPDKANPLRARPRVAVAFRRAVAVDAGAETPQALRGIARQSDSRQGSAIAATLSGTFTAGTSITATVTAGGASATVQLAPAAATTCNYDSAATLAAVAGNRPGFFSNDRGTVVVAANGSFTSTTSSGCSISGTVLPRASGKNVYDVTVTFGGAPCGIPNGTGADNAIITNLTGGTRQLAIAVATSDGANAGAFFGQR